MAQWQCDIVVFFERLFYFFKWYWPLYSDGSCRTCMLWLFILWLITSASDNIEPWVLAVWQNETGVLQGLLKSSADCWHVVVVISVSRAHEVILVLKCGRLLVRVTVLFLLSVIKTFALFCRVCLKTVWLMVL